MTTATDWTLTFESRERKRGKKTQNFTRILLGGKPVGEAYFSTQHRCIVLRSTKKHDNFSQSLLRADDMKDAAYAHWTTEVLPVCEHPTVSEVRLNEFTGRNYEACSRCGCELYLV